MRKKYSLRLTRFKGERTIDVGNNVYYAVTQSGKLGEWLALGDIKLDENVCAYAEERLKSIIKETGRPPQKLEVIVKVNVK